MTESTLLFHAVDTACREFEARLKAGESPAIEPYLAPLREPTRQHVFTELLILKLGYLQQRIHLKTPEEYVLRFPEYESSVRHVFSHPTIAIGPYRIIGKISSGGMGVVYKTVHPVHKQLVAVKVPKNGDSQLTERFQRETEILCSFSHVNLVRGLDAGRTADGRQYLAMEYVEGLSVSDLVERCGPVSIAAACEVIRQAAHGLQCVGERNIVHRDIKPTNLMVNIEGVVKILDWGLAAVRKTPTTTDGPVGLELTREGTMLGTIDYMAPEQCVNAHLADARADIYSLGCTLFFLLTGKPPFADQEPSGTPEQVCQRKIAARLSENAPSLPRHLLRLKAGNDLNQLLQLMMCQSVEDRLDSPTELVASISEFADAQELRQLVRTEVGTGTVEAMPSSSQSRGRSRTSSRKGPWYACAAGLVFLLMAAATSWYFIHHPETAENAQMRARLALLPGLYGGWWFDETPRFTPGLRLQVSRRLRGASEEEAERWRQLVVRAEQGDATSVSAELNGLGDEFIQDLPFDERKLTREFMNVLDQQIPESVLTKELAALVPQATPSPGAPATKLHLQALILHRAEQPAAADAYYVAALAAYARAGEQGRELRLLCESDHAHLFSDGRDHNQCAVRLQDLLERAPAEAVPFRISLLVALADSMCKMKNTEKAKRHMVEAEQALVGLGPDHLLRARLWEVKGWGELEEWRLDDAIQSFEKGEALFEKTAKGKVTEATQYLILCRQGKCTATHFSGEDQRAYDGLAKLLADIENLVSSDPGVSQRQRELIDGRKPNLYERMADCALYADKQDPERLRRSMENALVAANAANFESTPNRVEELVRLLFLRALVEQQLGNAAKARSLLEFAKSQRQKLCPPAPTSGASSKLPQKLDLAQQVATACLETDEQKGPVALAQLLIMVNLAHDSDPPLRRDMEILLLAAEFVCQDGRVDSTQLAGTVKALLRITAPLRGQPQARRYLARYYRAADAELDRALAANPPNSSILEEQQKSVRAVLKDASVVPAYQTP